MKRGVGRGSTRKMNASVKAAEPIQGAWQAHPAQLPAAAGVDPRPMQ